MMAAEEKTRALLAALRAGVVGTVTAEAPDTAAVASDFSRSPSPPPAIVVYAQCEDDVRHTLQTARAAGVPLALRGAGHSSNGRTLCPGGIVLINQVDEPRYTLHADGTVEVEARTTWRALEAGLLPQGRTSPVLTDYLGLTIGGTLSVGGYGVRSLLWGAQVDQVLRLRLLLPDGTALWCSADEQSAHFQAALAGLGQAGVIERVVMRTLAARRHFRGVLHVHPSLTGLADSLAWLLDGPGEAAALSFDAFLIDGMIVSEYATEGLTATSIPALPEPLARRPAARQLSGQDYSQHCQAQRLRWLQRFPQHRPLWSDWFFDYPNFCAFLALLDASRRSPALFSHLQAV